MTTTAHTTSTRTPADPTRRTALVAGLFYVLTFAASIPALFLLAAVLNQAGYITGGRSDPGGVVGFFLDIGTALAGIGSAVALCWVLKRQHEGFALGFVTTRLLEAAFIVIGVVSLLSIVSLRQHPAGADPSSLTAVGQSLVA